MRQTLTRLRNQIRHYPHLKEWLLPTYIRMLRWRWRLRTLVTPRSPIVIHAGNQPLMLYPEGSIIEALYNGYYEAAERDFLAAFLEPGMVVVDAGANVGLYTLIASTLVGTSGKVYAFEPGRITFELLRRNLDLNQCTNVVAARAALSNTYERMVLRTDPTHPTFDAHRFVQPMRDVIFPTSTDEVVECLTVDDYLLSNGVIDFLKVDVEGAELAVLQGAERTLARVADITILLECSQNREQVRELLARHGFQSFVWDIAKQALRLIAFDDVVATRNIILRRQPWMRNRVQGTTVCSSNGKLATGRSTV